MAVLKVQVEDDKGNVYYLHTSADVVFCTDGESVAQKLTNKIDKSSIVQNASTAQTDKVVSAAVAKNLQEQIIAAKNELQIYRGKLNADKTISSKDAVDIPLFSKYYNNAYFDNSNVQQLTIKLPSAICMFYCSVYLKNVVSGRKEVRILRNGTLLLRSLKNITASYNCIELTGLIGVADGDIITVQYIGAEGDVIGTDDRASHIDIISMPNTLLTE